MQPSYALLPTTRYPKAVGGVCYAILGLTLIGLKHSLVTNQSQALESRHAIPVCSGPITSQESQTSYPSLHCTKYTYKRDCKSPKQWAR